MEMYANMTRADWLKERKTGLGGSEIAAIMGLSPWATPVTVWLDKTGRAAPKEETEAMRIGTELESLVARMYSEETGRTVRNFNRMLRKGCLLGNLDRLVVPEGEKIASHMGEIRTDTLLECKTSTPDWDGGVPLYYQTQVQHYMGLDDRLVHADVACLFLHHKHFEIHRVERDDEVIRYQQQFAEDWWKTYVLEDAIPTATTEYEAKLIWQRANPGKTVDATADILNAVDEVRIISESIKREEADLDAAKAKVMSFMGDADTLLGPDGKPVATWKQRKDTVKTVVDWEAIRAEQNIPEQVVLNHTTTETRPGARTFLAKKAK